MRCDAGAASVDVVDGVVVVVVVVDATLSKVKHFLFLYIHSFERNTKQDTKSPTLSLSPHIKLQALYLIPSLLSYFFQFKIRIRIKNRIWKRIRISNRV